MADASKGMVGFVGLGRMGLAKAKHLMNDNYSVCGYDINPEARAIAAKAGVIEKPSAGDVAAASQTIIVIVPSDEDIIDACTGENGVLAGAGPGANIILMSSLMPGTVNAVAAAAGDGVDVLDVPSTRGPLAADAGTLALLVGGDAAVLERVRPVLACFSEVIHHLGPLGAGQVGKTVNNILLWSNMRMSMEVLGLAKSLDLDPETMRQAMFDCSGDSWALRRLPKMNPTWPVKDLKNAMILAKEVGPEMSMTSLLTELAESLTKQAVQELLGEAGED